MIACVHCGEPVDPNSPWTGTRVTGWQFSGVGPRRHGGKDVRGRVEEPQFIHDSCLDPYLQRGPNPHQEALL